MTKHVCAYTQENVLTLRSMVLNTYARNIFLDMYHSSSIVCATVEIAVSIHKSAAAIKGRGKGGREDCQKNDEELNRWLVVVCY